MRFDDDRSIDMVDPQFTRGELRRLERHTIRESFDAVQRILGHVNDGKEATVYVCETGSGLAAAKMYRAAKFRAFGNAKDYVHTQTIRSRRVATAIRKGTRKGKRMSHLMWVDREWQALHVLHDMGASVPQPYARCDVGILMEFIGDQETAAPMLIHAELSRDEAQSAWKACLEDVEAMLEIDLIHGDLSGYNVLWWNGRPRLIDLPQSVDSRAAPNAFELLHRDIANLARPFLAVGMEIDPIAVATGLAARYL